MHIVFLTFHYEPGIEVGARRTTALARALVAQGHTVTVVSAFGETSPADPSADTDGKLRHVVVPKPKAWLVPSIVRLRSRVRSLFARQGVSGNTSSESGTGATHTRSAANRLLGALNVIDEYKLWSWRAASAAIGAVRASGADVVCASGPPHSHHLAAALVSKRCGIPLLADLRDPWGHGYPDAENEPSLSYFLERKVFPRAAAITVTTDAHADALTQASPELRERVHVVHNGYDGQRRPPMQSTGHRLSILYAGSTYMKRNPFPFLTAIERLLEQEHVDPTRIEVTFVGYCDYYEGTRLTDWMAGKRCQAVTEVLPPVPASQLEPYVDRATVLLNLAQAQPWAIPAKTFEHMASGREVLVVCDRDSATARLIDGVAGVSLVEPEDDAALEKAIESLYQRHVVEGVPTLPDDREVERFSREGPARVFLEAIEGVGAANQPLSMGADG